MPVNPATAEQLAQQIHAGSTRLVIAVTGGGTSAIAALVGVPGASRSILAAAVPYSSAALIEWLGGKPDAFCTSETARAMAMAGYLKARTFDPQATTCGVACTASLASDRPKRGGHRAHLAFQTATTTATVSVELAKDRRSRAEEEAIVADMVLNLAAEACGVQDRVAVPLAADEPLLTEQKSAPREQQELLAGSVPAVAARGSATERPRAILPGAFHPLHQGHLRMAALAGQMLGVDVAFEISILNVDKPPLDFIEIDRRLRQFSPQQDVWLSRAPLFTRKAALFAGATFVVGADTIERIGNPRYYGGQPSAMQAAIETIAAHGCRFLVFGRAADGQFHTLGDLQIPDPLARICQQVPEEAFRDDVSSTRLRAQQQVDD